MRMHCAYSVGSGVRSRGCFLPSFLSFIHYSCFFFLMEGLCGDRYWDWTLDADGVWAESPVFSPIDGFGGNGMFHISLPSPLPRLLTAEYQGPYVPCEDQPFEAFCIPNGTGGGCVPDGPFRNLTLHLGPGQNVHRNDHCLRRNFHLQSIQYWFSASEVAQTLEEDSYVRFWRRLEGLFEVHRIGLHGAGHLGVGGECFCIVWKRRD